MLVHIVMKGYNLIDDRGMPHGAIRANPESVHLSLKQAIKCITEHDFAEDAKEHRCNGFKEGVNTSESRNCTLIIDGKDDCFVKIWICSRELEV